MDTLRNLVFKNRSYRRFDESYPIARETLVELVELTRFTSSAANLQPLKYILCADEETKELVFPCLAWAAYLKDWGGPEPGERPSAYMIMLIDETITKEAGWDAGIAAQTIMLGATEKGLGGCIIASINKEKLRSVLAIPETLQICLVLALGRPAENVVVEDIETGGDIRYWRDEKEVHHVPKRKKEELIVG